MRAIACQPAGVASRRWLVGALYLSCLPALAESAQHQRMGEDMGWSFAVFALFSGASLVITAQLLLAARLLRSRLLLAVALVWLVAWLQQCASHGQVAQYLFPEAQDLASYQMGLLNLGALAASTWVVREVFAQDAAKRRLDRLMLGLGLLVPLTPLGIALNVEVPALWLARGITILALGLGVWASLRGMKQPTVSRLVSALALGLPLLLMVMTSWAGLGWLPAEDVLLTTWSVVNPVALAIVAIVKVLDLRSNRARERDQQVQTLRAALVEGHTLQQHLRERTAELLRTQSTLRHALNAEHRLLLEQRQFFAMISHEFRTPLAIVDNLATTQVRFPSSDGAVQVQRARQIRSAVQRLTSLVNNCLVDERLSAGGFVLEAQKVCIAELVREASELVVLNDQQRIQVDTSLAPGGYEVDPTLLRIAISNLVDNAAKYSRRGCIRIIAAEIDDELLIAVSDDGPGIQPADRARIFRAFERGRHSDEGGGFGFGLYVTRLIARLHGGEVTVVNSYCGGSVFHLRIPPPAQA